MSSSRFDVQRVEGDSNSNLVELEAQTSNGTEETSELVQHVGEVNNVNNNMNTEGFIMMSPKRKSNDEVVTENEELKAPAENEEKEKKNRFHVEFVDPPAKDSLPNSPTHDTVNSDNLDSHTKTYYQRTFGHNTQEAIPMVAYYRNTASVTGKAARPTLDQLHEAKEDIPEVEPVSGSQTDIDPPSGDPYPTATPIKFGWIKGVLVRCVLNIWGVMLFLRLSWVVGQAGIGFSLLIIALSAVVTVITTLSMSAICTNGQVRGGGAYYLISRSLGPEFGGAIGLIFSLANAVAVAMYVVGFSETVVRLMEDNGATITGNTLHDTRIVGAITVLLLLGVTQLGMAWEAKMQIVLLFILLISILNFVIGTFIPASQQKMADGFFNYQTSIATENFGPHFRNNEDFFSLFSIFFPAATGILAGCNISGDLKDAQTAIPKGTLLAILITSIVYAIIAVMLGCIEVTVASGNVSDFIGIANTSALNCTTAACGFGWDYRSVGGNCIDSADAMTQCYTRGLLNDFQAMQKISWFWPVIVAGVFAATLSSALASLVSAPKIFQAVCRDKIFPLIGVFGKGHPKSDEPQRGYLLAFVIALAFVLIGELNAIAPIISNFFLASYTLINYSCFSASLAKSPGWRPAFKYYNMWLSLVGSVICCVIMFIIQWWAALITIVIIIALYKYVDYKKPDVNWGSSTQAYTYTQALNHTLKLTSVDDHVKNFRPQLLVLTGVPAHRPALIHFASQITKNVSLMVCGNVKSTQGKYHLRTHIKDNEQQQKWLRNQHLKAFYSSIISPSHTEGVMTLMQLTGLGKLRTNTVLMGFKCNWQTASGEELIDYINVIHNAFDMNHGICILRMKEGLDVSHYLKESGSKIGLSKSDSSITQKDSSVISDSAEVLSQADVKDSSSKLVHIASSGPKGSLTNVNAATLKASTQFQSIQAKGKTIDVWWLFDDGGLTILIPYLLSTKQQWAGCRMRIFTGGKKERIDQDKRTMAQLLSKFRISFEDVIVIGDMANKPKKDSIAEYESIVNPHRFFDEGLSPEELAEKVKEEPWKITDSEWRTHKDKTNRQIRLHELLKKHSKDSALIMMTLPMARKGTCPAALYMSWFEELTKDLPPVVLLRGNQSSVLTFYS